MVISAYRQRAKFKAKNRLINDNLEQQAQALFKSWFVDNPNPNWENKELSEVAYLFAGGDKPDMFSSEKTFVCNIPIYSNGIDKEGLYGYTNKAKIIEKSITISARGTIGYICLRREPYVPIVRLISVVPKSNTLSAEFLYLWGLLQNISGTGTTQEQLTIPSFKRTKILLPDIETLNSFDSVIQPIFDIIWKNKAKISTLENLRDTLLPKLMSGELKLTN